MKSPMTKIALTFLLAAPHGLFAMDTSAMLDAASGMGGKTATQESSQKSSLLDTLVETLGVTSTQAAGGTAALLNEAKANMSGEDFTKLLANVPDLSSLMGGAGGLGSMLGGKTLSLADQFSALGLDGGMIEKFTSQLLEYVQSEGGAEMMNLLKGALL